MFGIPNKNETRDTSNQILSNWAQLRGTFFFKVIGYYKMYFCFPILILEKWSEHV